MKAKLMTLDDLRGERTGGMDFYFGCAGLVSKLKDTILERDHVRAENRMGMIVQRGELGYVDPRCLWAYDNGAWRDFVAGTPFDCEAFLRDLTILDALPASAMPSFLTLPDVVAGGQESLAFSLSWIDRVPRGERWRWFIVVQDGMTVEQVRQAIIEHDLAGIFIGGSDEFKKSSPQWVRLAHDLGLRCHFGRASSLKKVAWARAAGCDSCDSAQFQRSLKKRAGLLRFFDSGYATDNLWTIINATSNGDGERIRSVTNERLGRTNPFEDRPAVVDPRSRTAYAAMCNMDEAIEAHGRLQQLPGVLSLLDLSTGARWRSWALRMVVADDQVQTVQQLLADYGATMRHELPREYFASRNLTANPYSSTWTKDAPLEAFRVPGVVQKRSGRWDVLEACVEPLEHIHEEDDVDIMDLPIFDDQIRMDGELDDGELDDEDPEAGQLAWWL